MDATKVGHGSLQFRDCANELKMSFSSVKDPESLLTREGDDSQ
jgi:hypothetical protein